MRWGCRCGLAIREATVDDVANILALYQDAGIESATPFTPEEASAHFAVFAQYPNYHLYVAELDSEIVGTYALLIMDNLAKRGRRSGIVEDVAVAPARQGQGIGRAMMQHARKQCIEADCYKLMLSSGQQRYRAHAFYDSLGMKRHGVSFLTQLD